MSAQVSAGRRIGYSQARLLLLGVGLAVLLLIAGVMVARGVARSEVLGILLFIPIFLGALFFRTAGGAVAAAGAGGAYVLIRYRAIQTFGWGEIGGLVVTRAVAYFAFGLLAGWAARQLQSSLTKLDLFDQIDDATGLFNARFFVQDTELEVSRAERYRTIFSVALVEFPASALDPLSRRQRTGILKELGRLLRGGVRTVDRPSHARLGDNHVIAVVLPETAQEGANIFTNRLAESLMSHLGQRGLALDPKAVSRESLTFPGDDGRLTHMRERFRAVVSEHVPPPPKGSLQESEG